MSLGMLARDLRSKTRRRVAARSVAEAHAGSCGVDLGSAGTYVR